MSAPSSKSRASAAVYFGLSLAALTFLVSVLSRPTEEALALGHSFGLAPIGVHAALTLAMTALTFVSTALARGLFFGQRGWAPNLIYAVVGAGVGFLYAFAFNAFGAMGEFAKGAGAYEIVTLVLGAGCVALGAIALIVTTLSQFGAKVMHMSRRDRVMTAPAAGVWVLEGVALVLLTLLHLRSGQGADAMGLTLLAVLGVCVLADVGLHALTWRAMDEFMRTAWAEAMAIGLVISLAVGFVYAGAQSLGLLPQAGIYHALTAFYALYLVTSLIHGMVRTPEMFASPPEEKAA